MSHSHPPTTRLHSASGTSTADKFILKTQTSAHTRKYQLTHSLARYDNPPPPKPQMPLWCCQVHIWHPGHRKNCPTFHSARKTIRYPLLLCSPNGPNFLGSQLWHSEEDPSSRSRRGNPAARGAGQAGHLLGIVSVARHVAVFQRGTMGNHILLHFIACVPPTADRSCVRVFSPHACGSACTPLVALLLRTLVGLGRVGMCHHIMYLWPDGTTAAQYAIYMGVLGVG